MACFCCAVQAQDHNREVLVKDLDFDGINDTLRYEKLEGLLICKLSSQQFKPMKGESFGDMEPDNSFIRATKNGFSISTNFMRWGYGASFRYNKQAKKMQLIGMSKYDFGNAANDGSGESSVNLLTNKYEGRWKYYDDRANRLVVMPVILKDMVLPKTFLDGPVNAVFEKYNDLCQGYKDAKKKSMFKR